MGDRALTPTAVVRECASSVRMTLPTAWRDIFVGTKPVYIQRMNDPNIPAGSSGDGRLYAVKSMIMISPGASVVISVKEQGTSLLYDTAAFTDSGTYKLASGVRSVTFRACPHRLTMFNGGFIVDRRRCVTAIVRTAGRDVERLRLAIGRGGNC
jgi:hypothetical protein